MNFLPEDCSASLREKQRQCEALARGATWKRTIRALEQMAAEFGVKAEAAKAMERAAAGMPPNGGKYGSGSCNQRQYERSEWESVSGDERP